jgi:glycosyltransferase involved in cell wall biosynthesis
MNILITTQEDYLAGSTFSVSYLAKGLAERGHRVFVIARDNSLLQELLSGSDVIFKPFILRKFDLKLMRQLADLIVKEKIQVVNAQSSKDRYLCIFTRWFFRLAIAVLHTRRQYPQSIGGALQRLLYVKGTDRIIVISHELKKIFVKKGFPERHLKVIHNGIPCEKYRKWNEQKVKEIAKHWNIKSDDIVIGCVSRLKNQHQLIESLVHLNQPHIKIMMVGIRPGYFDDLVSRLNIRNPIIYTGDVNGDEVLNYYKLFNISVLASTTDGFGLVLLESMAMNCPVVATDFGGIRDVVKNEWNGLLFEDQKVQQLAFALQRLLTDNKLRTKLVENGYVTAHQVFVMENTLASYEQFYREVYRDRVLRYKPANKAITFTE